jgi:hypothetical protein
MLEALGAQPQTTAGEPVLPMFPSFAEQFAGPNAAHGLATHEAGLQRVQPVHAVHHHAQKQRSGLKVNLPLSRKPQAHQEDEKALHPASAAVAAAAAQSDSLYSQPVFSSQPPQFAQTPHTESRMQVPNPVFPRECPDREKCQRIYDTSHCAAERHYMLINCDKCGSLQNFLFRGFDPEFRAKWVCCNCRTAK